jgi:hypothetical protein
LQGASSEKVSKNPKIYCTCRSLPKSTKTSFCVDCPLGVNPENSLRPKIGRLEFGQDFFFKINFFF